MEASSAHLDFSCRLAQKSLAIEFAAALRWVLNLCLLGFLVPLVGCGTTQSKALTEQLLVSDAVDRAISQIDFSDLSQERVYLDDQFLIPIKGPGFVNAEYVESSIRQHLLASGARLQETKETADIIVEARMGAMGSDGHEVVYGIPQNNSIANAANLLPNGPPVPSIPELSVGKTSISFGAAKVAVFAYERESREPIWQSGVLIGRSNSKDVWLLGAGPVQSGTIYSSTRFAGQRLAWLPFMPKPVPPKFGPVPYMAEMHFDSPAARERMAERSREGAASESTTTASADPAPATPGPTTPGSATPVGSAVDPNAGSPGSSAPNANVAEGPSPSPPINIPIPPSGGSFRR